MTSEIFDHTRICSLFFSALFVLAGLLLPAAPALSAGPSFLEKSGRYHLETKEEMAILSFKNHSSATPFVGAGVANSGQEYSPELGLYVQNNEAALENFEYKIGFGMNYSLNQKTGLTFGYQWDTGSTSEILGNGIGSLGPNQDNQQLSIGIKVNF